MKLLCLKILILVIGFREERWSEAKPRALLT